jgi:hypothetical protein
MDSIKWPDNVPENQFSLDFIQKMANRMVQGFFKYGPIEVSRPGSIDRMKSLRQRLERYESTGNTEWLVDAANMAMIQFILDGPEKFRATSTEESPGLAKAEGGQLVGRGTVDGFYKHRGD